MRHMRGDAQDSLRRGLSATTVLLAIALLLPIASMQMEDEHSLVVTDPWEAPSADESTVNDWIVREGPFDFSGTLYEEGDEEGGRVCHPDCPSGWEDDEYDLWLLNASTGVTTAIEIDAGGDIDGTDLTLEYCVGDTDIVGESVIGTLFCTEFANEVSGSEYHFAIAKRQYKSFYRISPEPSWGNDDVDYTIGWVGSQFDDEPPVQVFGIEKSTQRTHTFSGYVCINECTSDAAGRDVYDVFSFDLRDDEEVTINVHSYPDPDRGNMRAWLILPEPINDSPYIDIYFDDEEEWTFHLDTRDFGGSTAGSYELFMISEQSNGEDGMTYQIVFDQLWVSPSRDPNADYDDDGWTDFEEPGCGTSPHSITQVPGDWDSDDECDNLDDDDDADGVADAVDSCQFGSIGTVGNDTDGDGCKDIEDACPTDPDSYLDSDGDGVCNIRDSFPYDGTAWLDSSGGESGFGQFVVVVLIIALVGGVLSRGSGGRTITRNDITTAIREVYNRASEVTRSLEQRVSSTNQGGDTVTRGENLLRELDERERRLEEEGRRLEEEGRRLEEEGRRLEEEEPQEEEDEPRGFQRKNSRFM